MELYRGETVDNAKKLATTFVTDYNGLADATVTVNIPPVNGPHAGNGRYAEVLVDNSRSTYFVHILGINSSQTVGARAVAGYEALAQGEGAIVLNPNATPGLSVSGGATLKVSGAVLVNSKGAGVDQYGVDVDWGIKKYAGTTANNSTLKATLVEVKGGIDVPANFQAYNTGDPNPLFCRATICPDPLRDLPTPTDKNGVNTTNYGAVSYSNGAKATLNPGIYNDIAISTGATVNFNPGIYVLSPKKNNQGLRINGNPVVTGTGVMFYSTGNNYSDKKGYGYWDALDDSTNNQLDGPLPPTYGPDTLPPAPDPGKVIFAGVDLNLNGASVTFTGLQDGNSPFNNILFYQRRRNTNTFQIQANAGQDVNLAGTLYAKWGQFSLAGAGKYDSQFVAGSMDISGQAVVSINNGGKSFGLANQVFLVE
jgi:hypothetical protein